MRHALNNLQATVAGFGVVNQTNVFKVLSPCVSHVHVMSVPVSISVSLTNRCFSSGVRPATSSGDEGNPFGFDHIPRPAESVGHVQQPMA
jgi:hypothetical protein